jgi:hypothetical protein
MNNNATTTHNDDHIFHSYYQLDNINIRCRDNGTIELFNEEAQSWTAMNRIQSPSSSTHTNSRKRKASSALLTLSNKRQKRQGYQSLPTDIILYILSFWETFKIRTEALEFSEMFGRFPSGLIHSLYMNMTLDTDTLQLIASNMDLLKLSLRDARVIYYESTRDSIVLKHLSKLAPQLTTLTLSYSDLPVEMCHTITPYAHMVKDIRLGPDSLFLLPLLTNVKYLHLEDVSLSELKDLVPKITSEWLSLNDVIIDDETSVLPIEQVSNNPHILHLDVYSSTDTSYPIREEDLTLNNIKSFLCKLTDEQFQYVAKNSKLERVSLYHPSSTNCNLVNEMEYLKVVEVFLNNDTVKDVSEFVKNTTVPVVDIYMETGAFVCSFPANKNR